MAKKRAKSEEHKKNVKSEEPKKKKPISLNILEIAKRLQKLEETGGGGGSADSAKRSDIATEFNTGTSYPAGNFVYYEGKLYQFNADHSAGSWDPTDVVEANVTDQIVSNASAIAGLTASDVSYGTGSVKDALDDLVSTKHTGYGHAVNISGYTSTSNYYTCPADGVVYLAANSVSDTSYSYAISIDRGITIGKSTGTGANNLIITVPVIKNERIYTGGSTGAEAFYTPYT